VEIKEGHDENLRHNSVNKVGCIIISKRLTPNMNPENRAKTEANSKNHADLRKRSRTLLIRPQPTKMLYYEQFICVSGIDKAPNTKTAFKRS
jgi:hypothetical protein